MNSSGRNRQFRTVAGTSALLLAGMFGLAACASDEPQDDTAAAVSSTSALPSDPASGEPVKIGFVSTEGGAAVSLPEMREGAEAAVEYLNNNGGGLAGRPVELVVCKQQEEPTSATACANQFVEQQVAAVLSPGTSMGPAIVPIVIGAGIPYVTLNGVAPIELTSPEVASLSAGLPGTLTAAATAAQQEGMSTFTMFASDGGGIAAMIDQMGKPIFEGFGVQLDVVPVALGIPDPTPVVTAGLADNPEGVSFIGDAATCTSVLKAVQTTAPTVKKVLIPTCLDENVVKAIGIDNVKGNIGITATDALSDRPDSVLFRSILAEYAPDLSPTGYGSTGYQTVMALAGATDGIAGEVDAESIREALRTSENVEMPAGGGITFTCNGTAFPMMPSICSSQMLIGEIDDQGIPVDLTVTG
ncbi:ABC transporter substrate-binding protein [Rhodococcus rhodochrous]|uniref:ABC transporter substrate-binding protein n=1 Tax=Rhodococcus rhodochrous TaxID=1829 RepID=UPI0024B9CD84|nr:ABC transporter substrate-binding protein [Rhodococcus rhodochrous]MDJ0398938.1 ABC transporter substrate-binding protein [Rhodococcus rhodochrous]